MSASALLDPRSLRMFLALAEELHYGRAAQRLCLSQPPLTKGIQQLEARLQVRLFDRNQRRVALTAAGTALVGEAQRLLAQSEQAVRLVQRAERGDSGQLRIGFVAAVLFMGIQETFVRLEQELPGLDSHWQEMGSSEQLDALAADRIDIGFAQVSDAMGDMCCMPIGGTPLLAALPETHPLAGQRRVALAALADDPFVAIPRHSGPSYHDLTIAACMAAGFSPRLTHYAKHLISVVSLVAMGRGVALVPRSFTRVRLPGVVFRPLQGVAPQAQYSVIWHPDNPLVLLPRVLEVLRDAGAQPKGHSATRAAAQP